MSDLFALPFAFVDLETTGANAARDRITEVAVVEWDGEQFSEWSSLVNPHAPIPPFITSLTGISDAMVADAPSFAELAPDLLQRLHGRLFVAHNARFDYGFLKNEFLRLGVTFRARTLCTVKLSKRLFPGEYKHNLDAVAARNGLVVEGERHRALTDAQLIYRFVRKLRDERDPQELAAAIETLSRQVQLPAGLDAELVDTMPEGHGVYLFFGEQDQALYVGKSNMLKKRVLAHFGPNLRVAREVQLSQQVRRIDWVATAGELGSLLVEARLIRQWQPQHNPAVRVPDGLCSWRFVPNADGTARPELVFGRDVDLGRSTSLYGLFASEREATNTLKKIAEANKLCLAVLGLDKSGKRRGNPCAGMQLGRCRGACVGKEPLLTHQARLAAILAKQRLQPWPFVGRVALREQDEASVACDWHVFDHWAYLGTVASEAELADLLAEPPAASFEPDSYRILSKYLAGAHRLQIVALPGMPASGAPDLPSAEG